MKIPVSMFLFAAALSAVVVSPHRAFGQAPGAGKAFGQQMAGQGRAMGAQGRAFGQGMAARGQAMGAQGQAFGQQMAGQGRAMGAQGQAFGQGMGRRGGR